MTLVELFLALSIFSVVAVSLYTVFFAGLTLHKKSVTLGDFSSGAQQVLDTLSLDLENMVLYRHPGTAQTAVKGAFTGNKESLSFILPTASGLKKVRYYLSSLDEEHIHQVLMGQHTKKNIPVRTGDITEKRIHLLIREETPFSEAGEHQENLDAQIKILSEHIQEGSLKFSYARIDNRNNSSFVWDDLWAQAFNPAAVRIEITLRHPKEKRPLVIRKDIFIPRSLLGKQSFQ